MAEWYVKGDMDQGRLSRILDVAQDLKVQCNNQQFVGAYHFFCLLNFANCKLIFLKTVANNLGKIVSSFFHFTEELGLLFQCFCYLKKLHKQPHTDHALIPQLLSQYNYSRKCSFNDTIVAYQQFEVFFQSERPKINC